MTGLLYWNVTNWTRDPWRDVEKFRNAYPGEGMLVYPGREAGLAHSAVPSMRLMYIRDSINDYDYIQLAKDRGQGE